MHKNQSRGGEDFDVKCTILDYETDAKARKTLDAFWIAVTGALMNNKNECLSITNEYLPLMLLFELRTA